MTSRSKKLVYALLSSLVFTACTKTPADNPSAGSSVQMMELNKDLKSVYIDDAYRNTYEIFPYSYCDTNGDGMVNAEDATNVLLFAAAQGADGNADWSTILGTP